MAATFTPYTYIQCPCSDPGSSSAASAHDAKKTPTSSSADATITPSTASTHSSKRSGEPDEDDRTFDPRSPRANYSLYPLEYLLYCEDCHQIRCPRCVAEEIVTYYCPSCLFEVPTSNLKSEGNRCTRSCFQCPICIAPLTVTSLDTPPPPPSSAKLAVPESAAASSSSSSSAASAAGPFVLTCSYCQWSSTEIGIKFDKVNGLHSQLAKIRNGGKPRLTPWDRREKRRELGASISLLAEPPSLAEPPPSLGVSAADSADDRLQQQLQQQQPDKPKGLDIETQFNKLKQFYQRQLAETGAGSTGSGLGGLSSFGDISGFGSPSSLSRIMSMYTSGLAGAGASRFDKKAQGRPRTMREAREESEGFLAADLDESAAIARLCQNDDVSGSPPDAASSSWSWDMTASADQRAAQQQYVGEPLLHGRARFLEELRPIPMLLRTKRSKRCPMCRHIISKPEAKSTNNRFRIRLVAGSYIPSISIRPLHPTAGGALPMAASSSSSRTAAAAAAAAAAASTNVLEPLKPVQYILTFKNPIFENVKVTLAAPSTTAGRFASKVTVLCPQFEIDSNTDVWDDALRDSDRAAATAAAAAAASASAAGGSISGGGQSQNQAVPGKIWERGRNWVSIVVEIVPPSLDLDMLVRTNKMLGKEVDESPVREDEDVVEVPMFVRVEWEAEVEKDGASASAGRDTKDAKEKRELAYWCVLGIGRVRRD